MGHDPSKTNKDKARCGGCGGEDFTVWVPHDEKQFLFVLCKQCGDWSELGLVAPRIVFRWCTGSDGLISIF